MVLVPTVVTSDRGPAPTCNSEYCCIYSSVTLERRQLCARAALLFTQSGDGVSVRGHEEYNIFVLCCKSQMRLCLLVLHHQSTQRGGVCFHFSRAFSEGESVPRSSLFGCADITRTISSVESSYRLRLKDCASATSWLRQIIQRPRDTDRLRRTHLHIAVYPKYISMIDATENKTRRHPPTTKTPARTHHSRERRKQRRKRRHKICKAWSMLPASTMQPYFYGRAASTASHVLHTATTP